LCPQASVIGQFNQLIDRTKLLRTRTVEELKFFGSEKKSNKMKFAFYLPLQNSLRGVATDALNQKVITGDSKGILKFWRFKSKELVGKLG
jgi:hypothetical protein